jgi:hypothetical protein
VSLERQVEVGPDRQSLLVSLPPVNVPGSHAAAENPRSGLAPVTNQQVGPGRQARQGEPERFREPPQVELLGLEIEALEAIVHAERRASPTRPGELDLADFDAVVRQPDVTRLRPELVRATPLGESRRLDVKTLHERELCREAARTDLGIFPGQIQLEATPRAANDTGQGF